MTQAGRREGRREGGRGREGARRLPAELTYRRARDDDLLACAQIWSDSIADYVGRLNQPWFGGDLEPLRRLLAHFVRTDRERFWVATDPRAADAVVGFGSATLRGKVWFLGMLFVLPAYQAAGVGRRILEQILPADARRRAGGAGSAGSAEGHAAGPGAGGGREPDGQGDGTILGTATDSVQPISNALYSQYGMVPRLPVFNFVGYPMRPEALGALPAGVRVAETTATTRTDDLAAMAQIDTGTLGYDHRQDHEFLVAEGRRTFVARSERGEALGYGTIAPSGRFGPVAAIDERLLAPLVGHLFTSVRAPGAYASWIPGAASDLFIGLLGAGLRFESFPTLLLWDRPFADFSRYVPINLALL